jgi:hypothetical protein
MSGGVKSIQIHPAREAIDRQKHDSQAYDSDAANRQ